MRVLRKVVLGALVLVLVFAVVLGGGAYVVFVRNTFPRTQGTLSVAGLQGPVEVYRDKWGVPHIFAENEHDLFVAQGYVHAQDRLWQMEFNRRVGAGRLSEVLGESTLDSDRFLRTIGLYRAAQADLEVTPPEVLAVLQAYADGVNAFIATHQQSLPLEFTLLGFKPEPWTPADTVVWGKVMSMTLGGNWESELVRQQLITALGEAKVHEVLPPYPAEGPFIIPSEAKSYGRLDTSFLDDYQEVKALTGAIGTGYAALGSNNWVVDGTKTATGRPLLANDTHLDIQMPSIWYEVHLVAGALDVVGFSFPGTPGVIIGHNRDIAWGVTNAGPDTQDLYVEKINPANPNQYEFRGQWEDMTVIAEEIRVKGRSDPEQLTVRLTRHGPLMTPVISDATEQLALRWAALEGGGLFRSVYLLDRASNWDEFRTALHYWQAPSQNFVYADKDGNIGYQMPGDIPIRAKGQGLVPVPGWTGEYEWTGYIPFDELPFVYNPPTHYIVTANNKVVPDRYPYFISAEWADPSRAQRISDLLHKNDNLTVDDMRDIQADTYSIPAAKLMPYVLALGPEGWLQERAFKFLRAWDFRVDKDSGAAGIMEAIVWRTLVNTFGDELENAGISDRTWMASVSGLFNIMQQRDNPWFDDVRTPEVEDRDAILRRSVQEAMEFWSRRFGDLVGNLDSQWAWGKLHTATFDHPLGSVKPLDLIFNRGPLAARGSWCTVDAAAYAAGDFAMTAVSSQRQIVDVGAWENSRSQHTTGQSGQPFNKHYDDMIQSWEAVKHHPMLYEKDDIVANQEALLTLVSP
jgi:penicillin amidase